MSNYVKSTNFTSKDALPSGNSLKIVKGAEFDVEFNAIAAAITSKADSNSPDLIGTPTAPTAAPGTNTSQIASTAFVTAALRSMYPVGSVYINATDGTNPGTLLGFGTWVAFAAGRVPVGFSSGDPLFDTAEEVGGSKDAIIVSHTHTATTSVTDAGHTHGFTVIAQNTGSDGSGAITGGSLNSGNDGSYSGTTASGTASLTATTTVAPTGSSGTNANLQPYITVYMWKRTA